MKRRFLFVTILVIILILSISGCNSSDISEFDDYDDRQASLVEGFIYLNDNNCIEGQTLFIGDSITEFYPTEEFFNYVEGEVYNRGISGDTSNKMVGRIEDTALFLNPRTLIIQIGINDLNVGYLPEDISANIDECVRLSIANNANMNIVLVSLYPYTKTMKEEIIETNELIQAIAIKYSVTYVDIFNELADSNGVFNLEYTYDGLHPSILGYAVITEKLFPYIN